MSGDVDNQQNGDGELPPVVEEHLQSLQIIPKVVQYFLYK